MDTVAGHAVVLGRAVRYLQPGIVRAVEREGLSVADGMLTLVRLDEAAVEVGEPLADTTPEDDLATLGAGTSVERGPPPGRYPVIARFDVHVQSPPQWVVAAVRQTRNLRRAGPQRTLDALAGIARSSDFSVLPSSAPEGGRVNARVIRHRLTG